jgi:hypothetical protein
MPVFEYVLITLLASGAATGNREMTKMGAEAIVQPSGGAELGAGALGQDTGGSTDRAHKGKVHSKTQHHRRHSGHKGGKYEKSGTRNASGKKI